MKDFNLNGYLKNNRLLNESIGGYVDIKPTKFLKEDDEFDQWCQENPEDCKRYKQSQEDADKAFTDEFGSYSSDETNEAESMTADPGWEYDDEDFDGEYAAHMEHYAELESQVMNVVSGLMNSGVDNKEIAIWLRDIANDIDGDMMEEEKGLEEKKPVSDDQRKAIWASYNNEAKDTKNANPKNVTAYIDIDWHKSYEELMNLAKAFNVKAENLPDEDNNEYNDPLLYRISVPLSREQDLFDFLDNMDDETYQTPENDEEKFQGDIDNIRFSQGKPKVKENIKESRKPKAKGKLKEGKIRPSSSEFTWDI